MVEEDAELCLLALDLAREAGEAQPAQRVVRRAGGDRVGAPAAVADLVDRALPALLDADAELRAHELDLGAHDRG